jgi:hypothetical protein
MIKLPFLAFWLHSLIVGAPVLKGKGINKDAYTIFYQFEYI